MRRLIKGFQREQEGFTLVELLVVIAILAILVAVVVPNFTGLIGKGELQTYNAEKKTVQTIVDAYLADNRISAFTAAGNIKNTQGPGLLAIAPATANIGPYFRQAVKWCWKYDVTGLVAFEPTALNCLANPPAQPAGGT